MTVIHWSSSWLPLTQYWMYDQVRFLPAEIDTHIVCGHTENLAQFTMPNIHSLSDGSRWQYFWHKAIRKLGIQNHSNFLVEQAIRLNAHVLHSHFGNVGWENLAVVRRTGLKHVVSFYGYDVNFVPRLDRRWPERYQELFREADCILCEGPHMAKCLVGLGCPEPKIHIVHLGVSVNHIAFRPRRWIRGKPLRILIAASFREKKGIPYALEALSRLLREVPLEITLIGDATADGRSPDEKNKILTTISKFNLQARIRMLGFQPHSALLREAYAHHIFLSPSITASDGDTEGGVPFVITEMMATGMPIVSSRHCDIPAVVKDRETGLLAAERDVEGLIHHLRWLGAHPDHWESMVGAGRRHVEAQYDAEKQAHMLKEIYLKLR